MLRTVGRNSQTVSNGYTEVEKKPCAKQYSICEANSEVWSKSFLQYSLSQVIYWGKVNT